MRGRLTEEQRAQIAADAHDCYEAGESWREIALELDLHPGTIQRLVAQRCPVTFRRWGQKPVADPAEVARRREAGETLDEIARALGCSRTAVRTALESEQGPPVTRYPRLAARRMPTDTELAELRRLLEACPPAPRSRPGYLDLGGPEGLQVATRCLVLVDDGIPMATLSRALGHGPTWVHWLLGKHDLQPPERQSRSTSRRTRSVLSGDQA
ncbi:helix-turn-helix domain-containing protein [Brachybacterium subflavum]|uniref:helix-turn-helix domain-containing protein n=1 Tax=Brachybacterium subflavum TaxID=2585206 RepID=UPI0012667B7A|nr:helix-turn-helix domain-containing protein [Brachybacterium subflavum]